MSIYALIPLLPLAAALTLALLGRRLQGAGHRIVIPAVAGSFLLSIAAFVDVLANGTIEVPLYRLLEVGRLVVDFGFFIDPLTVLLLLLVTGVSTVVQVYSSRYMIGDARHSRFFAVTALFTSAMTILVMSSNLLLTFIFWEVMGLCSYLLISHYAERRSAYRAATKVFLVNSIADVGLLLGVVLTFHAFGTLDIPEILSRAQSGEGVPTHLVTILTLCLFVGAIGKSAQVPAHVWLPLAMEAPTPVSALIHAATMVNAGPFLLVRLSPVIVLSEPAMAVIATVGGATALFAAIVSLTQTDVKRTLAYSTISQLGFMTLLCGVGAFVAAIFHLVAHGCFKAFLFLSTGNVLAATHRHVETPDAEPPRSRGALFAGALVMSVLPPLVIFSGPYRQLWLSQSFSAANIALWIIGLGTVFFTAMTIFRSATSVFSQGPPGGRDGAPRVMPTLVGHRVALARGVLVLLRRQRGGADRGTFDRVLSLDHCSDCRRGCGLGIRLRSTRSPLRSDLGVAEAAVRRLLEQGVLRRVLRRLHRASDAPFRWLAVASDRSRPDRPIHRLAGSRYHQGLTMALGNHRRGDHRSPRRLCRYTKRQRRSSDRARGSGRHDEERRPLGSWCGRLRARARGGPAAHAAARLAGRRLLVGRGLGLLLLDCIEKAPT
jgi:NADH-quinone oxidoreductase subunit L